MHSTKVRILGREHEVFGYPGEGWFDILSKEHCFDGQNGFLLESLSEFIKEDSFCIDVGANYGIFTLAMAQLCPEGWVDAFEPDPKCFAALRKTLEKSHNVEARPLVIGKHKGAGYFVEDSQWRSSSHFVPNKNGNVLSRSLDEIELEWVDFIKIDAEGSELDILAGAMETLHRCHPTVIMEFNTFALVNYRNLVPRDALDWICRGFPRVRYYADGNPTDITDRENFIEANMAGGYVNDLLCTWK